MGTMADVTVELSGSTRMGGPGGGGVRRPGRDPDGDATMFTDRPLRGPSWPAGLGQYHPAEVSFGWILD
jgi:hypothetical protein